MPPILREPADHQKCHLLVRPRSGIRPSYMQPPDGTPGLGPGSKEARSKFWLLLNMLLKVPGYTFNFCARTRHSGRGRGVWGRGQRLRLPPHLRSTATAWVPGFLASTGSGPVLLILMNPHTGLWVPLKSLSIDQWKK